ADHGAERDRDERAQRADPQRDARPIHDPAPHVAAEDIRPENERPGGRQILEVDGVRLHDRIERSDQRRGDGDGDQEYQDDEPPRRRAVAEKAPPPLVLQPALAQRPRGFRGRDERDEQCEPAAERHAVTFSSSPPPPPRTRRRGSAIPSRMSASRFPATTTTLAMSAVAVT